MHTVKLRKIGNSYGLVVPKDVLDRYSIEEGQELTLIETENGFAVTPYDVGFEKAMKVLSRGMKEYRNALRELAK
jgi:antitoxin MazE